MKGFVRVGVSWCVAVSAVSVNDIKEFSRPLSDIYLLLLTTILSFISVPSRHLAQSRLSIT